MARILLLTAVAAMGLALAQAHCPNLCSGHGVCRAHQRCTCYPTWMGADCSLRQCPFSLAWNDLAHGDDDAHHYAECSNAGICDRKTGECKCNDGYEGDACRRLACPEGCSGHGTCETTAELGAASSIGDFFESTGAVVDKGIIQGKNTYAHWDAKKTQSCRCDPGWTGINCASRVCPYGNDPLTTESDDGLTEVHEVQAVIVGPNDNDKNPTTEDDIADRGYWSLTFTDNFGKEWTTRPIRQPGNLTLSAKDSKDTTQHEVKAALMSLPNHVIDDVEVNYEMVGTEPADYTRYLITFTSAATQGNQHKLKCNFNGCDTDGCQPRLTGLKGANAKCVVLESTNYRTAVSSGDESAASLAKHGSGENTQCSNRGLCDGETGLCNCFDGFTGEACSIQTILV